ncbi:MAG: hypothetical protein M0027_18160 [Candidatus Dormibacteraeota bacterium]|nr:hypothetical protein [Candidatus Dormibacteraeota bacterium]
MRTLGRRRHRRGGIATLVVILARLLAVIAAPATAYAATLAGSRVSASTLAAPLRTGPPSSLTGSLRVWPSQLVSPGNRPITLTRRRTSSTRDRSINRKFESLAELR